MDYPQRRRSQRENSSHFADFLVDWRVSALVSSLPPLSGMSPLPGGVAAPGRSVFVDEAATLLGVSRRTVYYRIRQGRLATFRTRCGSQRILLASIEALLRDEAARRAARRVSRSEAEPLPLQIESLS
jgi:excisionase family DNA binding protein